MATFTQSDVVGTSSQTEEEGIDEVHQHEINDFGIGTLVFAMALGTVSRMYITHLTGLPYTVVLLLLGLIFGVVLHEEVVGDLGLLGESLGKWADVSPDVILFVFLPILIFESAFNTDVHIFQREFWQVLALAVPGVVIATTLSACVVHYVFPYEWGWQLSLMLGGMLSATDPVAVVALLKELGVSERLAVLIEGESLLNDATAIVVFIVFRDAYVGANDSNPLSVLETAARMSLGGPVVGVVLGMLGSFSLGYIIDDALTEITLTVIVCFSSFMISEATKLHVSGVLAVVTTGLVMSFYARGRISPGVEESMHTFWSMATYVANTVIFFVSGLIIGDRALFDEHIEAREWGLLGLLYLALQAIRLAVCLILLPILTRGGYGMSYKQIAVLAFAGLRGAVVLTLGLMVVEDERIDEDTRSRVLFYVAGIAAMTLVINGSLAGPLVHYLGLDRSTTAETEVFVRACAAIESRLEHKLDLLKGDRFLGDADWELVWRYIPISTSKSYWHRIRHGNINLSEAEEEDINLFGQGRLKGAGIKGELEHRGRQLRKWFTRKVLRLPGGIHYDELPFRLRQIWYGYHKSFHLGSLGLTQADPELHRREMELHRLHAEPRMILEAEAWSNLNEGGGAADEGSSSTALRGHLDHMSVLGMTESSGVMQGLGQPNIAKNFGGANPRSVRGPDGAKPSAMPANIAGSSSSLSGAGRAVEVVKKLKEDRRRAAQAVHKAEARLSRLKKDMGLIKHKGEEEEMAESILHAKRNGSLAGGLSSMSMHGPRSSNINRRGSMPHSTSDLALNQRLLRGTLSRTEGNGDEEKQDPGNRRLGGGDGGVALPPSAKNSPYGDDDDDDAVGLPMDEPTPGVSISRGVASGGDCDETSPELYKALRPDFLDEHNTNTAERVAGKGGRESGSKSSAAVPAHTLRGSLSTGVIKRGGGGDGHAVPSSLAEAPEWNPYEDSHGGKEGKTADTTLVGTAMGRARHIGVGGTGSARVGGDPSDFEASTASTKGVLAEEGGPAGGRGGMDSVIRPGTVTMDSMAEARVRFLTAVKAHFTERYRHGWLSSMGLRVLKENMDAQLDYEDKELEQWSQLSAAFRLPSVMAMMRSVPILGSLVESYMYRRLTFIFELASNFISAHEDVDILELLNEGPVAYQLALEKNRQLQEARETLAQQLPVFPELARSLKTRVAARYMLVQHRDVVHELFHHGHINERECEGLIEQNNTARVRLDYHPHADQIPDRMTLLKNVPFLRFCTEEEKEAIINNEKACQEEFYGSSVVLMQEKTSFAKGHRRAGWFNVVRGAVRQKTQGILGHKSTGGTLRTRKLAKERLVSAGNVIGLDEQLLDAPYQCTYVTASFVHLFFFDKTQMLMLAEQYPNLKRGLWWLLAVSVVRHHRGFRRMDLMGVYQLMRTAEFRELRNAPATVGLESRHRRSIAKIASAASMNLSKHNKRSPTTSRATLDDGKLNRRSPMPVADSSKHKRHSPTRSSVDSSGIPGLGWAAASLNESRHKLSKGLRRSVSRNQMSESDTQDCSEDGIHKVFFEAGSHVLLLQGTMLRRQATILFGPLKEQKAVTIIRDVSGAVEFTEGSVIFIMPGVLLARASSRHQLLMREVEWRHRATSASAAAVGGTGAAAAAAASGGEPADDGDLPLDAPSLAPLTSSVKWKTALATSVGGIEAMPSPTTPTRSQGLGVSPGLPLDAVIIGVADEINPTPAAHPDTLRRERTLRDAGLAAKAVGAGGQMYQTAIAGGAGSAATAAGTASHIGSHSTTGGGLRAAVLSRPPSMRSVVPVVPGDEEEGWAVDELGASESGGGGAVVSDTSGSGVGRSTARMSLHSSRPHGDTFVQMVDLPPMPKDPSGTVSAGIRRNSSSSSGRSSMTMPFARAGSNPYHVAVHEREVARRLEEERLAMLKGKVAREALSRRSSNKDGSI